ncbi:MULTISPECIES: GNAT family N-acetyltransferase [Pontibacillus]|uniref:GNAT family N-acetyltransferase n=1 Tax=Pontibacillus chungwhensis TaxID=265426 RepID=A0ABY8V2M5_9BACI|nr:MULTISPECIES: GNAT family N-acetyltransferase [Pontibacillus]MCD5323363.1 GNAT family N-acetyltransferase [Pontibacillus sp. HN14]WIG00207.1 GNAT family N-acetyltransferase [Pontibacillus chungwhensis]
MHVNIREGKIEDAPVMWEIQQDVASEGPYLITITEELKKTSEHHHNWVSELIEHERKHLLVAEIDEKIIGWIVFQSPSRARLAHTGTFGMMVQEASRGMGIGRQLLEHLMEWAKDHPVIEKVSLGVFSSNENAIRLYQRLGFVEEGRKVREIKLEEGQYVDDILMYRFV